MPICKRANFESTLLKKNKNDTFNDNEKVFFCETTKEIFRDYEDYFRHVMAINSTVWQCEATGRDNLTYAEALKSEKRARKKMELFKESLRAPVMLVIDSARQSSIKLLSALVTKFLRKRYFLKEHITLSNKPSSHEYTIVDILPPNDAAPDSNVVYEDTENLIYKVQRVGDPSSKEILSVSFSIIRRQRSEFTTDSLHMFIKHNVTRVDGILRPKPESYKKYVTDHYVSFKSIFIGKMPHFTPAKIKPLSENGHKKQSTLNKFLVKDENNEESIKKAKEIALQKEKEKAEKAELKEKSLREQMEKLRLEKMEKLAQLEREKQEKRTKMLAKVELECDALLNKTDDLERTDQRVIPVFRPVNTLIDKELVGDAFMLREFMHSFQSLLTGRYSEVFRDGLNFCEMSRAFAVREVVGPLSEIFLVLLGTIFQLQKQEESECNVEYQFIPLTSQNQEPQRSQAKAALVHYFSKRFLAYKINELPSDALTLSEVLRLHLLSSGAAVKDRTDKWRIMYRNGYSSLEDPGFAFLKDHPRLIHALSYYPVYQLPFRDLIGIARCLMAQILTYSTPIHWYEERLQEENFARNEIKNLILNENRRVAKLQAERRTLTNKFNQECLDLKEDIEESKKQLEKNLNRKMATLLAQSQREHRTYEQQLEKTSTDLFYYIQFLGMDRAYRKYYILESMPGLFIEHDADSLDTCLSKPPTNELLNDKKFGGATLPKNRRDLRAFLVKMYKDAENEAMQGKKAENLPQDNKENQENRMMNGVIDGALPNGDLKQENMTNGEKEDEKEDEVEVKTEDTVKEPPTQTELYMCSGDPENCIVHSPNHEAKQTWSYIYRNEEIEALIESLNPLGERECQLREQLTSLRTQILRHVKKCPHTMLTISDRTKFENHVLTETYRKYNKANYGLNDVKDMNMVMHFALAERILKFEMDIYSGDLGRLKVKDLEKWRQDIVDDTYDPQGKLQWGDIGGQNDNSDDKDVEDNEEVNNDSKDLSYHRYDKFMPGEHLSALLTEKEEEDDLGADEFLNLKEEAIETLQGKVKDLASALLQIEQGIQRRFLKEPFGLPLKTSNDKELLERKQKEAVSRIKRWEISLMKSTSYSQVFLHLNVLNNCIVWSRSTNKSLCQICRCGSDPDQMLLCDECNGGTHMFCMKPKMKTVPEGNWYCQRCVKRLGLVNEVQNKKKAAGPSRPKRKFIVDDTDNTSETSSLSSSAKDNKVERSSRSKRSLPEAEIEGILDGESYNDEDFDETQDEDDTIVSENETDLEETQNDDDDDSEDDAEKDESLLNGTVDKASVSSRQDDNDSEDDESVCKVCSYDGSELYCAKCKDCFHLECINLRRPPRYVYICSSCKSKDQSKRKHREDSSDDNEDDDDSEEQSVSQPASKRSRSTRNSLRGSGQINGNHDDYQNSRSEANSRNTSHRRSSRRTGDDLPLNSSALYKLLEDVMKEESAWPFLRPVTQSEVPDYHKIIKTPMDLAKVKSKLNMGEYRLNEEVMNDILLVFKNCEMYNEKGNEVYEAGTSLERSVIEHCKELNLPYIPSSLNN